MQTLLTNSKIFIGDGNVINNGCVLIDGQRIIKVIDGKAPDAKNARKIDLSGNFLFPGFIDSHVHLCLDGSADPVQSAKKMSLPMIAISAATNAHKTLLAGVTTVRDMGGIGYADIAIRDAIKDGLIEGPRVMASGRLICMTGGHGWQIGGREADGPEEIRKAVREQIKSGCDVVKLMATGGVLTPGADPEAYQLNYNELKAGIEEAHKSGKKVATHAQGTIGILNALKAGIDSIEHGCFLDDEAGRFMAKNKIPLIPTLTAVHAIISQEKDAGIPEFIVEKIIRVQPHIANSLRIAKEAQIPVAMGTDAGTPYNVHGKNLMEIILLTKNGYQPREAFRAATQISARVLGLDHKIGTIQEGKLADLVAIKGNPLEDIDSLIDETSILMIMQGGKLIKDLISTQN